MRVIPTRVHGALDYLVGAVLIAAPWLFRFADGGPETWVPVVLGGSALVYTAFTDFEPGLARDIPVPIHLALDAAAGALLATSPWLLGFADRVWLPHLLFGLAELGVVLMSQTRPADRRQPAPA